MNGEERGILVGMVLGDGYLNVRYRLNSGKYNYESSELIISHSVAQKDYLMYKADLVRRIFGGNFSIREKHYTLRNGKTYFGYGFSKSNKYFKVLKGMMYRDKVKTITTHVLNMLTPHGIAIWYMDDGHARRNINNDGFVSSVSTNIATCCPEKEAILVCEWFKDKYNIRFSPFPEKGNFSIRCNTQESHNFIRLIEKFIIPSMRYKLSHVADLNLQERQAPIGYCKCGNAIYANKWKGLCSICYMKQYRG